jgi:hypothetical protein
MAPEFDSASDRNEYHESYLGRSGSLECEADNLTAIYESIVKKMWHPRHLTTTARYGDSFTLFQI